MAAFLNLIFTAFYALVMGVSLVRNIQRIVACECFVNFHQIIGVELGTIEFAPEHIKNRVFHKFLSFKMEEFDEWVTKNA